MNLGGLHTRGSMMRLYFCLNIPSLVFIALLDERTFIRGMTESAGLLGWIILYAMAVLSLLGFFDTLINDFAPSKFTFYWALNRRHWIYMGLAFCFGLESYFAANIHAYAAMPYYLINTAFIVLAAFKDVSLRYNIVERRRGGTHA